MAWYSADLTDDRRALQHSYQCEKCGFVSQSNDQRGDIRSVKRSSLVLEKDIGQLLAATVLNDKAGVQQSRAAGSDGRAMTLLVRHEAVFLGSLFCQFSISGSLLFKVRFELGAPFMGRHRFKFDGLLQIVRQHFHLYAACVPQGLTPSRTSAKLLMCYRQAGQAIFKRYKRY